MTQAHVNEICRTLTDVCPYTESIQLCVGNRRGDNQVTMSCGDTAFTFSLTGDAQLTFAGLSISSEQRSDRESLSE